MLCSLLKQVEWKIKVDPLQTLDGVENRQQLVDIQPEVYPSQASSRTRANHSIQFRQLSLPQLIATKIVCCPHISGDSLPASVGVAPALTACKRGLSKQIFLVDYNHSFRCDISRTVPFRVWLMDSSKYTSEGLTD